MPDQGKDCSSRVQSKWEFECTRPKKKLILCMIVARRIRKTTSYHDASSPTDLTHNKFIAPLHSPFYFLKTSSSSRLLSNPTTRMPTSAKLRHDKCLPDLAARFRTEQTPGRCAGEREDRVRSSESEQWLGGGDAIHAAADLSTRAPDAASAQPITRVTARSCWKDSTHSAISSQAIVHIALRGVNPYSAPGRGADASDRGAADFWGPGAGPRLP